MNGDNSRKGMEELLEQTRSGLSEEKKQELETLAASGEGQRVREMLGGDTALRQMMQSGDAAALRKTLKNALGTPEGAALLQKLSDIMK